jgi:hypothetical protein
MLTASPTDRSDSSSGPDAAVSLNVLLLPISAQAFRYLSGTLRFLSSSRFPESLMRRGVNKNVRSG